MSEEKVGSRHALTIPPARPTEREIGIDDPQTCAWCGLGDLAKLGEREHYTATIEGRETVLSLERYRCHFCNKVTRVVWRGR